MLNNFERTGVASVVLQDAQDNDPARPFSDSERSGAMDRKARRISRKKERWRAWDHSPVARLGTIERHCGYLVSIEGDLWVKVRAMPGVSSNLSTSNDPMDQ